MDIRDIQKRLGLDDAKNVRRKAEELLRLCSFKFDSAAFGVGEIAKPVMCVELACKLLDVSIDRSKTVKLSGISDKAYARSLPLIQNALGIKPRIDVKELVIKFGCMRLIQPVKETFLLFKQRFVAGLPAARKEHADFSRPIFLCVSFFLCARKHKIKIDKPKLIEISSGTPEEFDDISSSMEQLCFDVIGMTKEKTYKNTKLLDALPSMRSKRERDDDDDSRSDESQESDEEEEEEGEGEGEEEEIEIPGLTTSKKEKRKKEYSKWKKTILEAKSTIKSSPLIHAHCNSSVDGRNGKRMKQTRLNFTPNS